MRYATAVPLGRGGAGEVYKAWDADNERFVALKLLSRDDPEAVARLQREARAQARLDHPNICQIYEVGESEDGRPFIAMRYVDGVALDAAVQDRPLEERLALLAEIADTVQVAHQAGLIHRDLKPSNILVETEPDGGLHPFVLDFGIVRVEDLPAATITGDVLGTPGYLSPEQARGDKHIDRRSDVFTLGILLFELIADHNPFAADSKVDAFLKALDPTPPRLRQHVPQVSRRLEAIVDRALAPEPRHRYDSAHDFAEDLRAFLAGETPRARPITWTTRAQRVVRRHPRTAAFVTVAMLTLAFLGGWAIRAELETERRAALTERLAQRAGQIEARARFERLLPIHDITPALTRLDDEVDALEAIVRSAGDRAGDAGAYALGRAKLATGRHQEALSHLKRAHELGSQADGLALTTARALTAVYSDRLAEIADLPRRARAAALETARSELGDEIERYLTSASTDDAEGAWINALVAFHTGDFDRAIDYARDVTASEAWRFEADLLQATIFHDRALDGQARGSWPEVEEALDRARSAARDAIAKAPSDPDTYLTLCSLVRIEAETTLLAGDIDRLVDPTGPSATARVDCERALEVDASRHQALERLGRTLYLAAYMQAERGNDPTQALDEIFSLVDRALTIEPQSVEAQQLRGDGYFVLANRQLKIGALDDRLFENASNAFESSLELAPDDPYGWSSLGRTYWIWAWNRTIGATGGDNRELYRRATDALEHSIAAGSSFDYVLHAQLCGVWASAGYAKSITGGDGFDDLARGRAECRRSEELAPEYFGRYVNHAYLESLAAEVRLTAGVDPRESTEDGREPIDTCLEINPQSTDCLASLATMLVAEASWREQQGERLDTLLESLRQTLLPSAEIESIDAHNQQAAWLLFKASEAVESNTSWQATFADAKRHLEAAEALSAMHNETLRLRADYHHRLAVAYRTVDPARAQREIELGSTSVDVALRAYPGHPRFERLRSTLSTLRDEIVKRVVD
ncbi:MAG: protein kinase [Acidobacteriota bacterium]